MKQAPHNEDNITKLLDEVDLTKFVHLIKVNHPIHIASVRPDGNPNLAVASDVLLLNKTQLVISNNQMIWTPHNVQQNSNVVLTSFNDKWAGIRMTGTVEYHTSGKYLDMCRELYGSATCTPRGAMVITITKIEEIA